MLAVRVVHLTGARAGQVDLLRSLPATLGAAPEAAVQVPGAAEQHAVLALEAGTLLLRDLESGRGTSLAGLSVSEAPLRDGDVLELGPGGPQLQLRFGPHESPPPRRSWLGPRAWRAAALAALAAALGLALWHQRAARRLENELLRLRESLRSAEEQRVRFERRVEAERQSAETGRRLLGERLAASRLRAEELNRRLEQAAADEARALRGELAAARERLANLEGERAAAERVIATYGASVALIQGVYAFHDATGRPLRQLEADGPSRGADGALQLSVDGRGAPHSVSYFGTGFVAGGPGRLLTNRHVAEPWWQDEAAEGLRRRGFEPRLLVLRAFFPGQRRAFELRLERLAASADLALLRFESGGLRLPVPPLDRGGRGAVAGQPVTVVGYPTGLEAILAKTDPQVVSRILDAHGMEPGPVTEALSARGLIRPSTTQGHIGDVTQSDIVFDAPSTHGGSGAPVFNREGLVIGVEYAVLASFEGSTFAVPVKRALELLRAGPPARTP